MKKQQPIHGALRARTRALCALTLAMFTSATASAQTWGTESNTNFASYQSSIAAGVTMTVTSPVDGKRQVILKGVYTDNLTCWCTLIVNGSESITTIDDIPRGTYQINSSGTVGTALASQGISGSDIIGSGGCYHGSNTPSSSQGNWFHTMTGYVIVADDNTDAHHNLIFMHSATFHSNVQDEGKCDFKVYWSGSTAKDFRAYKFIQNVPTVTGGSGTATRRDQNNQDKAGYLDVSYYITVTATPDEGYSFVKWQDDLGNDVGMDNPMTFHAWGPKNVVAVLAASAPSPSTYTVTWKSEDGESTLETDADLAADAATSFDGATPTKAGNAQYTYTFDGWTTAANGGGTFYADGSTPVVSGDATYYAHFSQSTNTYTVAASVSPVGAGSVSGTGTFAYGTDVTLTATPTNRRYQFVRWTESAVQKATTASYTIDDIDAAHTLVAEFEEIPVTIADNEESSYYTTTLSTFTGSMDFQLMRTFYAGMWNTVCFPFALSASQIAASDMSGASFYTLISVTGDAAEGLDFNVSEVTSLSARTPYLVQVSGANITNPVFEGVTLAASAFTNNTSGTNVGDTKFFGTVHPTDLEIGENSGFLFLGQNNALYWPNVANKIRAFRAYFYSGDGVVQSVHPRVRIVLQNETTTDLSDKSEHSAPSVKKYMENGSLVIERDGKKYNAVGQEIK